MDAFAPCAGCAMRWLHQLSTNFAGAFDDDDVTHVAGDVDPVRDLDIIFHELRAKDLEQLNKKIAGIEKTAGRDGDKRKKLEYVSEMLTVFINKPPVIGVLLPT